MWQVDSDGSGLVAESVCKCLDCTVGLKAAVFIHFKSSYAPSGLPVRGAVVQFRELL
jgi:hypothetical protein